MKPLFKNYNFDFAPTEKKILNTLVKQIINQLSGDPKYSQEVKYYESIQQKLNSSEQTIRLTKEESKRLEGQLTENIKHLELNIKKAFFFKRWLMKPLLAQYSSIYNHYFKEQKK